MDPSARGKQYSFIFSPVFKSIKKKTLEHQHQDVLMAKQAILEANKHLTNS
jgi:hypothetical protein